MTVTWPQDKGYPLADDFGMTLPVIAERSSVDAGPAKQRRLATSAPFQVEISYLMKTAERHWLENFYMGDAAGGGVWFAWWYPVEQDWYVARFVAGQPPRIKAFRPDWIVSVTLEVR